MMNDVSYLSNMMRVRKISWNKSSFRCRLSQKISTYDQLELILLQQGKTKWTGQISVIRTSEKSFWVSFALMELP